MTWNWSWEKAGAVIVAIIVCMTFSLCLAMVLYIAWHPPQLDAGNRDFMLQIFGVLSILVGVLAAKFGTCIDYFTGSSVSSAAKSEQQNKTMDALTAAAAKGGTVGGVSTETGAH